MKGTSGPEGRHKLYQKKDTKKTANVCGQINGFSHFCKPQKNECNGGEDTLLEAEV